MSLREGFCPSGNKPRHDADHQIDEEVGNGSVAGVFNLAKVLQFVENGFNQRATAQDRFLEVSARYGFHVLFEGRDE